MKCVKDWAKMEVGKYYYIYCGRSLSRMEKDHLFSGDVDVFQYEGGLTGLLHARAYNKLNYRTMLSELQYNIYTGGYLTGYCVGFPDKRDYLYELSEQEVLEWLLINGI